MEARTMATARLSKFTDDRGHFGDIGAVWISMRTGYNPQFVSDFKAAFNSRERRWHYSQKIWLIKPSLLSVLEEWLEIRGYAVIWETPQPAAASPASAASLDYGVLQIAPHACYEVAQAAYRALCMKYHPDKGGLVTDMARLNTAWERVKKGFGK